MSRSRKKHPIGGWACNAGQKKYRTQENKAKRRAVSQYLMTGKYELMPHEKDFGNEWDSPRDGKQYWIDHDDKFMRK